MCNDNPQGVAHYTYPDNCIFSITQSEVELSLLLMLSCLITACLFSIIQLTFY